MGEKNKISVCCVSQSFLPYIGGLARYVEALGKQFIRNGHEFRVIQFKTPNIPTIDFASGIEMVRANVPKVGRETLEKYLAFKESVLKVTHEEVGAEFEDNRGFDEYLEVNERLADDVADAYAYKPFDVLNVHDFQILPLARALRKKHGMKIPIVLTWHVPFVSHLSGWWKNFFLEYMSDYSKVVFSTGEYLGEAVAIGLEPARLVKISPFIELGLYKTAEKNFVREKYGLLEGDFVVLCVSRIDPRKGQEILIDSVETLVKKHGLKNVKCVFVGNGSFSNELLKKERASRLQKLVKLAEGKGLQGNVIFTGKLEGEELYQAYESSSVVVQPSIHEGFGLTVSEGMCFGKPVVGSNVGGLPEQIQDGVNGYLFEKGDTEALAGRLLALARDPELCRKMGDAGRTVVRQKFSSEAGYEEYAKLYADALSGR